MNREFDAHPHADTTTTARELEAVVRRLWTTEPRCPPTDRISLLTELGSIGLALERIILSGETRHTGPGIDDQRRSADLAECDRRIRNLLPHWPDVVDVGGPASRLVAA